MGAYQYQALKKSGTTCKGVVEADSERHARQILRKKGLIPTQVLTYKKTKTTQQKNKISAQDLTLFTRQLATLLAAGISVEESLQSVSEQTTRDKTRQLIIGVRTKVMEGYSLAQAMNEYPNAFSELYCATIAAGEQTGRLDLILEKLADYSENQQQLRQKIQQALIYPILMLTISLAIISFLLAFVVPKIIEVFSSSGQSLPPMTRLLIAISAFVQSYGFYLLFAIMFIIFAVKKSLAHPPIRRFWHKKLLKTPLIAYLIKTINASRYIHTFSILFAAGVNIIETMRVSTSLISNLIMRDAFNNAAIRVKEGAAIHQALRETHYLNPMALHLIASGEKSGQLATLMDRTSKHMDNEVRRLIDAALTLLEPLIILFMGGVVLFIVLATLLPIFSMEQLVI